VVLQRMRTAARSPSIDRHRLGNDVELEQHSIPPTPAGRQAAQPLHGRSSMPSVDTATPLPATERVPTLDILRGFALMGILIMNMPGFSSSFFAESDGSHLWTGQVDQIAEHVREALFSGKFNSMFSLLFGIGFTIQFARMQERDPGHATALYLRRLSALMVFGVIHAFVFWPGDVLHNYAILGFVLVLVLGLRRVSDRGIVALIGVAHERTGPPRSPAIRCPAA